MPPEQALKRIKKLDAEMMKLARNLEFEQAALCARRDSKAAPGRAGRSEHLGGWASG